jgi:hypothetical protein
LIEHPSFLWSHKIGLSLNKFASEQQRSLTLPAQFLRDTNAAMQQHPSRLLHGSKAEQPMARTAKLQETSEA